MAHPNRPHEWCRKATCAHLRGCTRPKGHDGDHMSLACRRCYPPSTARAIDRLRATLGAEID